MQETSVHTGWLSPTGEFIQCNTYAHIKTADEIYSKFTGSSKCTSTPDRELLKLGWVSISIMTFFDHGFDFSHMQHLTSEQIAFLRPYYTGQYGLPMRDSCKRDYEFECAI